MCDPFSRVHLCIYNMLWEQELNTKDFTGWVGHEVIKAAVLKRFMAGYKRKKHVSCIDYNIDLNHISNWSQRSSPTLKYFWPLRSMLVLVTGYFE